ncbi:hypothetical protein OSTOST_12562 [Ostertagia ostertagi]
MYTESIGTIKQNDRLVCQQSFDNLAICFAIYASFLILFSKFFNTAYLVKREKTAIVKSAEKVD